MNAPFSEAREFLAKVLPWPQRDDAFPSYVNIHYTVKNEAYAKPAWRGTPCQSLDEAVKAVDYALNNTSSNEVPSIIILHHNGRLQCERK